MEGRYGTDGRTEDQVRNGREGARLVVAGTGAWGRCMGRLLAGLGHDVTLWSPTGRDLSAFCREARPLSGTLRSSPDLAGAASGADGVFIAVSSPHVRSVAVRLQAARPAVVVSLAKGLEAGTGRRLSEVIGEALPEAQVCALSGGSHAEEAGLGLPFALAAAARDVRTAERVKAWLSGSSAAVTVTDDLAGVELCAVLKNVIAIAAGIADGLALGDNFRGALVSAGMAEIARLLERAGGRSDTLTGPAGLGDLLATALSPHSRNRRFGLAIGRGLSVEAALREVGAVVEGLNALEACLRMEERFGLTPRFPLVLREILQGERRTDGIVGVIRS